MAHPVVLPRQGQSVESCIITQWHKQTGDTVKEGELLFSYETDKASFDETAKVDGTLLAIFFREDDDVPVLTNVAVIGQPGEDYQEHAPDGAAPAAAPEAPKAAAPAAEAPKAEQPAQPAPAQATAALTGVSPRARMTARRLELNPADALPTGPQGRVIERDIFTLREQGPQAKPASAPEAPAPAAGQRAFTETRLSNVRKVIARAMHQSISSMAQLTHHSSFDATRLLALRQRFKAAPEELGLNAITLNDLILFSVSRVLPRHRDMNAHFLGDTIRHYEHVHLGIAVDTPRGLLVPSLYDADLKSLKQISEGSKALITAAQAGSINPDLLTEGTFTVTNLGALGVELFTPIINPPQVGILGVDNIIERVRTVNGQLTAYPAMGLSLTYDHRAIDGAPASRFLQDLCRALEQVDVLLAD